MLPKTPAMESMYVDDATPMRVIEHDFVLAVVPSQDRDIHLK